MSERTHLPDRRPGLTQPVIIVLDGGKEQKVLVTFGFDDKGNVREVFCADFKAGTMLHSIILDACVLLSRELQRGVDPDDLRSKLCTPPSLIGTLLRAASDVQQNAKDNPDWWQRS